MFFRQATISDAESLSHFEWKVPHDALSRGEIYIAGADGVPQAYAILNYSFYSRPWIAILFVAEPHRRRGLGRTIIQEIEKICPGKKLFTSTELPNIPMQSLLKSLGFQLSGIIENLQKNPELIYFKLVEPK
jgi:GNAT superfamily N-acetyltransferase